MKAKARAKGGTRSQYSPKRTSRHTKKDGGGYREARKNGGWYKQHPRLLKEAGNKCQMFGVPVGRVGGKYYPYQIHHLSRAAYKRGTNVRLNKDVIVLCPFAHQFMFHCLLSGGKRTVGEQKVFPNFAQAFAMEWCIMPGFLKTIILFLLIAIALHGLNIVSLVLVK